MVENHRRTARIWLTAGLLVLWMGNLGASRSTPADGGHPASIGSQNQPGIAYGVYDPDRRFANSDRIAIEHMFLRWETYDREQLRRGADYTLSRNRWLMVTLEPWIAPGARDQSGATLFSDVQAGQYDSIIDRACGDLGTLGISLFIRWGHEMEEVTGRYPWAQHDAQAYVNAYRHFVNRCRPLAGHSFFVWSPKGSANMARYYPGDDYVDYVGLSVYGLETWDMDHRGRPRFFDERFQEAYPHASAYKKPIMIAELGVRGEPGYVSKWMQQLANAPRRFPLLRLAAYFNAREVEPWPAPYGAPDWRIHASSFPFYAEDALVPRP